MVRAPATRAQGPPRSDRFASSAARAPKCQMFSVAIDKTRNQHAWTGSTEYQATNCACPRPTVDISVNISNFPE